MTSQEGPGIAWITGAGKGIGREMARRLARDGWTVAASARTEEDLLSLRNECPAGRLHVYPLDIADRGGTEAIVARMETDIGAIDLAVLNAGTHIPMSAGDFSVDTLRTLVETNLMGTANGLAALLPRFIERNRGQIAVVGSVAGYRGLPTSAGYGATKAALINMCEALKPELERHEVRLTLINPGFVKTPLTDRNAFPMPFLVPVEDAVEYFVRKLPSSSFEIAYPRRLAILMKVVRLLPDRLFFALTRRMIRK